MVSFSSGRTWIFTADFTAAEIFFDVDKTTVRVWWKKATDIFAGGSNDQVCKLDT